MLRILPDSEQSNRKGEFHHADQKRPHPFTLIPVCRRAAICSITDGIITRIETSGTVLTPQPGEQVIDASSYVVAPGLVDIHVHFRDPGLTYKEDIHTGAMAAGSRRIHNRHLHGKHKTGCRTARSVITDILTRAKKEPVRILQTGAVSVPRNERRSS